MTNFICRHARARYNSKQAAPVAKLNDNNKLFPSGCVLHSPVCCCQVIAFASHPAALVMAAAEGDGPGLKSLASFNSQANQQDLVAALDARIAKETAELADLRAKVARERER